MHHADRLAATVVLLLTPMLSNVGCTRCEGPDDEQQVRALIADAVAAAEAHDLGGLMGLTTGDFVVKPGSVGRQEVKGVLLMAFRRYGRFGVRHPAPVVSVAEDRLTASADLPFLIVREGAEAPDLGDLMDDPEGWMERVADMGDAYYLELGLEKTGDGWRAARARIRGTHDRWSL